MAETRILVELDVEDYDFIVNYDPDRERTASRAVMVEVLGEIQDLIEEGYAGSVHIDDDRVVIP